MEDLPVLPVRPAYVAQLAERSHGKGKVAGSTPAVRLQKEHHVKLDIRLKSFDASLLARSLSQLLALGTLHGMTPRTRVGLPTRRQDMTVLRSPHVHKKSREQFVLHTYKMWVCFDGTGDAHTFLAALKTTRLLGVQVHLTVTQTAFVAAACGQSSALSGKDGASPTECAPFLRDTLSRPL